MKKVLLVVDVQNDFMDFPTSKLPIPNSKNIIPLINEYINSNVYKDVLLTMDTHKADHIEYMDNGEPFPEHCIKASEGWCLAITPFETTQTYVHILYKNMFDMWEEPDIEIHTGLFEQTKRDEWFQILLENGVTDIEVCGVATDICVNFAIQGLLKRGFNVTILKDLCKELTYDVEYCNKHFWDSKVLVK